jgi:non-ribosomal peptide synthetase component E (peptide arylation enzyme)
MRAPSLLRGLLGASRPASSLAALVAAHPPSADALLAPQQGVSWTYGELDEKARCLAAGLEDIGYKAGDVAISDVPNIAENLLLQVALSHLGAAICTPPKDAAALDKLVSAGHTIRGSICVDGAAPPGIVDEIAPSKALPLAYLSLVDGVRPPSGSVALEEFLTHCPPRGTAPAAVEGATLGIFGGAKLTHGDALALGTSAAHTLGISERDRICCSVTLMHAFGIGSACTSALVSGAAVVLPAVGGIKGCGDPNQRASVTLDVLASAKVTVMFGDSHTLKALKALDAALLPPEGELALRTGVVKIGSGSDFLEGVTEIPAPAKGGGDAIPLEFLGVIFHAMGKKGS